ncbi:HSF-type DNA-binding-domain-containing protein, partial [Spinellus fusiger]
SLKSTKGTDGAGSVPEFIQKLFRMLENKAFKNTFCWGPTGKTFIVKDTNEFSKTILPKHFKHCNFASFVRQLNKYDFHKVRNAEDAPKSYSDQAWEFVHPKFIRDRKDLLEEIRRKTPGKQKKDDMYNESEVLHTPVESCSVVDPIRNVKEMMAGLQSQIKQLEQSRTELETTLEKRQHMDRTLLNEFMQLNENMAAKDTLIQQFLQQTPSIRLTLTQPSQALETVQQKGPGWTVPPRILLVDDDSVYRDISGRLLQVIGCTIDLAKDGVEAIGKMGAEKYDLILMDIVMPNLDGISATRNIRQYDALTPIISMTSNFTDSDIMQYIGSGMTDILPKPFSKRTLYSMLEKY